MDFLKDESGKYSSTRLAFLTWVLGTFLVWAIISMKNMKLEIMPLENIGFITMLMTGKVIQVFKEIRK
jgi:predicted transporter